MNEKNLRIYHQRINLDGSFDRLYSGEFSPECFSIIKEGTDYHIEQDRDEQGTWYLVWVLAENDSLAGELIQSRLKEYQQEKESEQ